MINCYCDYDAPEVYSSRMVRARKTYRCWECDKQISVGERHEYAFGVSDGGTYQPRTCASCVGIRTWVKTNIPCFCWAHGNLIDDCKSIIDAAYQEAPDEVRGLRFGFNKLLVLARRERQLARAA